MNLWILHDLGILDELEQLASEWLLDFRFLGEWDQHDFRWTYFLMNF